MEPRLTHRENAKAVSGSIYSCPLPFALRLRPLCSQQAFLPNLTTIPISLPRPSSSSATQARASQARPSQQKTDAQPTRFEKPSPDPNFHHHNGRTTRLRLHKHPPLHVRPTPNRHSHLPRRPGGRSQAISQQGRRKPPPGSHPAIRIPACEGHCRQFEFGPYTSKSRPVPTPTVVVYNGQFDPLYVTPV